MKPADEKKLLAQVLRRLDNPQPSPLISIWFLPAAWAICFAMFFGAFQFAERLGYGVFALVFSIFGILIGIVTFARVCAKQEPIMRNHVDRGSIARRLAELDG